MPSVANLNYDRAFAATLDWWRDAGVDMAFHDKPRTWIASPEPAVQASARTRLDKVGAPPEPAISAPPVLPDTLDAFQSWWMSAPELDGGRCTGRVAPRGASSPELMIVVCAPESDDRDVLLSGPEGRLLDGFAAACSLREKDMYRASVLPCHSPGANWSPQANELIAQALCHHIALVAPKRLLIVGFVVLPLIGHAPPKASAVSSSFNHECATVPLLAVRRMPAQATSTRWKSRLWQGWLDWTA